MKAFVYSFIVLLMVVPAFGANLLVNGGFETGDLDGWTEAGPSTITTWQGAKPVPLQVFRDTAPMFVAEVYNSPTGSRHIRRAGMASSVKPMKDYSAGWTLAGSPQMGYPWISQIVRVAPGKYRLSASWDVLVANGKTDAKGKQLGCAFMVNLDSDLNTFVPEGKALNVVVWDNDSKGKWVHRSVTDHQIETKTGYIEVRLQMKIDQNAVIPTSQFGSVAVDNIRLDLTTMGSN